jgi:cyanophycinase
MDGTFLLLGSGEFEPWSHEVEAKALAAATGDGRVVILPTASAPDGAEVFARWGRMGLAHYEEARVPAEVLQVKTADDARDASVAARAEAASMIYFSGGKPSHLANVLRDSPLLAAVTRAVERGAIYAGCSAGAMVASRAKASGSTTWTTGLGFIPGVSFGVHWDRVRRVPGAQWFTTSRMPAGTWFVGIDEHTAILGDRERWQVFGLGEVTVRADRGAATYGAGDTFSTT